MFLESDEMFRECKTFETRLVLMSSESSANWAGKRLGLPEKGPGSLAKMGRRVGAIFVDWAIASLLSYAFFKSDNTATILIFAAEQILLLSTAQASIGHRVFGLRLRPMDGGLVTPLAAVVRTVLLLLVIPAAVWDSDNRGLHDKAAKTVLVLR